ncbi:hypothetical protein IPA_03935 [Ignicoccus pacificus DSM 13166]|uniref:Uncharacterized protein n=1 Tax=Ignicoccus pacificus DSM 13166 TaxID=940294 RepID=A0A977PKT8_9CREN|nr:hypothetical protein IPA_03935 [Ignicoccus pacificus DSM 13166]
MMIKATILSLLSMSPTPSPFLPSTSAAALIVDMRIEPVAHK